MRLIQSGECSEQATGGQRRRKTWHQEGYITWTRLQWWAGNFYQFSVTVYNAAFFFFLISTYLGHQHHMSLSWRYRTSAWDSQPPTLVHFPVLLSGLCSQHSLPLETITVLEKALALGERGQRCQLQPCLRLMEQKSGIANTFCKLFTSGSFSSPKTSEQMLILLSLSLHVES